jgi:hypothetical protein
MMTAFNPPLRTGKIISVPQGDISGRSCTWAPEDPTAIASKLQGAVKGSYRNGAGTDHVEPGDLQQKKHHEYGTPVSSSDCGSLFGANLF